MLKNSKKFNFCNEKLFVMQIKELKQIKIKVSFIILEPSSTKNTKLKTAASIFKLSNNNNIHPRKKKTWLKVSLSIVGKLYFKLFIKIELYTSCESMQTDKKSSGINALKTILLIIKNKKM